jgi:hypothetical protein
MLARIAAILAREILGPVIDEYRRLEAAPECTRPHADDPPEQLLPVTSATTELAKGWDHDQRQPVTAAQAGFRLPQR